MESTENEAVIHWEAGRWSTFVYWFSLGDEVRRLSKEQADLSHKLSSCVEWKTCIRED